MVEGKNAPGQEGYVPQIMIEKGSAMVYSKNSRLSTQTVLFLSYKFESRNGLSYIYII